MITRRHFLGGLGLAASALAVPLVAGQVIQRSRHSLRLWKDPGPTLRIAHVSDLHSSSYIPLDFIAQALDLALEGQPDVVALTGDLVNAVAPDPAGLVRTLQRLTARAPTYACLGNHDGGRWLAARQGPSTPDAVTEILEAAGIRVLRNQTERVRIRERTFLLTGLEDLWSMPLDTGSAGFGRESDPRVVLAHNPDTKDELAREPWDLMLSGHTHGGQIRLPFFGGRLTAPVRDDRYIEGLLPWGPHHLHISRGVGSLLGLRINCPPEVTLLELT